MCESFFATLECELLERCRFKTQTEARSAVFAFVEGFYNPRRRHSSIGYLSPIDYEHRHYAGTDSVSYHTTGRRRAAYQSAARGIANPRLSRSVGPVYSFWNKPRRWSSGNSSRTTSS
jgi:hypothetical protein